MSSANAKNEKKNFPVFARSAIIISLQYTIARFSRFNFAFKIPLNKKCKNNSDCVLLHNPEESMLYGR